MVTIQLDLWRVFKRSCKNFIIHRSEWKLSTGCHNLKTIFQKNLCEVIHLIDVIDFKHENKHQSCWQHTLIFACQTSFAIFLYDKETHFLTEIPLYQNQLMHRKWIKVNMCSAYKSANINSCCICLKRTWVFMWYPVQNKSDKPDQSICFY